MFGVDGRLAIRVGVVGVVDAEYDSIVHKYLEQMLHPRRDDDGGRRRELARRLAIREHTHGAGSDVAEMGKFVRVLWRQHSGVAEVRRLHEHAIDDPDIDLGRLYWRAFHYSHRIETIRRHSVCITVIVGRVGFSRLSNSQHSPTLIVTRSSSQMLKMTAIVG